MVTAQICAERFFFQVRSSHWYMVPESMRKQWEGYTQNDLEDWEEIEEFDRLFNKYRTNGDISHITFCYPEETA